MKPVSDLLHRTPWWALIVGALATFVALAAFVTPYHIIQYHDRSGSDVASRAIKREVDNAFAENAINVGRSVLKGMIARTTDPQRRAELQEALKGLEEARQELREVGAEILGAKREALEHAQDTVRNLRESVQEAQQLLREAQDEARKAQGEAIPAAQARAQSLQQALREAQARVKEAQAAEREARRALRRAEKGVKIDLGAAPGESPKLQIEIDPPGIAPPADPPPASVPGAAAPPPGLPPLPPDVASKIRRDVTGDMYRIGIGAVLILVLVPLFIVAIVVKFFADRSRASQKVAEAKRKEAEYHRMGQQVTEAKLAALQAQVEPHFLYNTLASVQALTEVDPARANEMTGHLIQYLRNALPKMRESVSTVGQEVELVRAYLNILQMRMGKRLEFEIAVPPELLERPFPPLMLPSLVENAIKHGLEPQREGGTVRITASLAGENLRMVVADTGRGFSDTPGAGVGLANIRERLAGLYGDKAHLTLEANQPHGVVATIDVPADGTRSSAAAAPTGAARAVPPAGPGDKALAAVIPPLTEAPQTGFWPRTWQALVAMERIWRMALYYLFIGLVVIAGVAAVGMVVAVAVGAVPVVLENDVVSGPSGVLVALAAGIIGFVVVSAALAIVMLVFYALGFFLLALLAFVACVVLIALSPILAPFILLGFGIWWLARRNRQERSPAPPPPPAAPPPEARIEPTLAGPGR
ncbi:MAG TPA: histidine kinase [Usitatibacter sp.]|nr:histidine kinase [Usitatibacter sp.]